MKRTHSRLLAATALTTFMGVQPTIAQSAIEEVTPEMVENSPCETLAALEVAQSTALAPFISALGDGAELTEEICRETLTAALTASGIDLTDTPADSVATEVETEAATEADAETEVEAEIVETETETETAVEETVNTEAATTAEEVTDDATAPVEETVEDAADEAAEATDEVTDEVTEEVAEETEAPLDDDVVVGDVEDAMPQAEDAPEPAEEIVQIGDESGNNATTIEVEQEDTAESTEAANITQEVQAADATGDDAEMTTDVVADDEARSSTEDFASAISAAPEAEDDSGLSNFEKFALGALGLATAGALLDSGEDVVAAGEDRAVVQRQDGNYYVLKDDNALLRRPGVEVQTQTFDDGSVRQIAVRPDGTRVETIRAADGQVIQRSRILPDGRRVILIDDTRQAEPVDLSRLPEVQDRSVGLGTIGAGDLRAALLAEEAGIDRRFSLQQVRNIRAVRSLVPVLELDAVTFDTGSAAIRASQAEELRALGVAMREAIAENPGEVFLVEGHTDAVGSAPMNLALSDRRAESVALALTEYFDVPPENMIVQGYGESALKVRTAGPERANRRATVRRITPLLQTAQLQ